MMDRAGSKHHLRMLLLATIRSGSASYRCSSIARARTSISGNVSAWNLAVRRSWSSLFLIRTGTVGLGSGLLSHLLLGLFFFVIGRHFESTC